MINLSDFIAALQKAIDNAAHLVAQQNMANLKSYFQSADPAEQPQLNQVNDISALPDNAVLQPRMITLLYPKDTVKGVVEHKVLVPLISLAPVAYLQPEEINLEIDLEFLERDNELLIGFPQLKHNLLGKDKVVANQPNAKLSIRINAGNRPAGITAIIEGYDKSLRAQIPN